MTSVDLVTLDALVLPPPLPALLSVLLVLGLIGLGGLAARTLPPGRRGPVERAAVTILSIGLVAALLHAAALARLLWLPALRAAAWGLALLGVATAWRAVAGGAARSAVAAALDAFRAASAARRLLLALLVLAAAAMVAVSLGPATDADSLDYHLGVPLRWLGRGGATDDGDWYAARLAGLGEMLGLLGLAGGTDGLGAALSAASALLVAGLAWRAGRDGGEPLAGAAMVLGCPVVLFLASTQKPALLPSAALVTALVLLLRAVPPSGPDLALALGLVAFATSCKYTFLLAGAPIAVLALARAARAGRTGITLLWAAAWTALLPLPVLLRNAVLAGDPLWPFLAALRDGPASTAARYATLLRESGGTWREVAGSVVPWSAGGVSSTMGLGVVVGAAALVALARRGSRTLAATTGGATLLLVAAGQPSARFFLDPFLWAALGLASLPRGRPGRGALAALLALGVQLAATAAMGGLLAGRLLPGAISRAGRERVLLRDASGRAIAEWLASRGAARGVLSNLRSRLFLPGMTGTDPILHAPSRAAAAGELARLVGDGGLAWLAVRLEDGLASRSPCRALPFVEVRRFAVAVRNPYARRPEETWGLLPAPRDEPARGVVLDCLYGLDGLTAP